MSFNKEIPHGCPPTKCYIVCRCVLSFFTFHIFLSSLLLQFTFSVASKPYLTSSTTTNSIYPPTHPLHAIKHPEGQGKKIEPTLIVVVTIVVALLLALFLFMAFLRCFGFKSGRERSKVLVLEKNLAFQESPDKDLGGNCKDHEDCNGVRKYSWDEIKIITMNFSKVIATGGFSTVYLAKLPGCLTGAVKVHSGGQRLNEAFKQELDILLKLNQDNIVKLLGYCDDREEEGALVFEFVSNGNLQEKLHGGEHDQNAREQGIPWKNRMAIAYQLAKAIEYLHEKCPLQIIHGDIKASNILLDENLNCKLCDFGFAKMGFSSTILPPSASPGVYTPRTKQVMMGSLGYIDPHYLKSGLASKKNDVYSFGVIILELVTGKEAFCCENGGMLTSIMAPMLKECGNQASKVAELVDPRLAGEFDSEEVRAMLSLAAMCLGQTHTLRPSASQILKILRDKVPLISFLDPSDKGSCSPLSLYQ